MEGAALSAPILGHDAPSHRFGEAGGACPSTIFQAARLYKKNSCEWT